MVLNNIKLINTIALQETGKLIRSSKIIIYVLFSIVIFLQVIEPLSQISNEMGGKISILEAFVACTNSGYVMTILPIFFLVVISDISNENKTQYYFHIRCSKITWIIGQLLYAMLCSVITITFIFAVSSIMASGFGNTSLSFSDTVKKYTLVYPEMSNTYKGTLLTSNLYNQASLLKSVFYSFVTNVIYFYILATIILIFHIVKMKFVGIVIDGLLITLSYILSGIGSSAKWFFPMIHTVLYAHYNEYSSNSIFPIWGSELYLALFAIVISILVIICSKKYEVK